MVETKGFARARIRTRLTRSLGATIAIGLVLSIVTLGFVVRTLGELSTQTATMSRVMETEDALKVAIFTEETFAFDYALSHSERPIEELREARSTELEMYSELARLVPNDTGVLDAGRLVRELSSAWQTGWVEEFLHKVRDGATIDAAAEIEASEALFAPLEEAIFGLEDILATRRAATIADVDQAMATLTAVIAPVGLTTTLVLILLGVWLTRTISGPLQRLDRTAHALIAGEDVTFVPERDDEIGSLALVLEQLRVDARDRYGAAISEADRAATFNRLADLTSFARDETELLDVAVRTLQRVAPSERGDILLLNNSTNHLVLSAAWGGDQPPVGTIADVDRIDRCPGIRRATAFIVEDLSDEMSVHCPVHPAEHGSLLCLPMQALGNTVGVIHLERAEVNGFSAEVLGLAARVAEQVALAIANTRLMKTMESLAMTDPLTGLRNARFFDSHLEQELAVAERDRQSVGLMMLDVDHFKAFNDDFGHPAGDEALRTLARVLRSTIRQSDIVARYGGEEFVIALRNSDSAESMQVAEKIRAAVEHAIVEIGPGRYGRITASIGVVSTDVHHLDQKRLLSLADAALYKAKDLGRNRVEAAYVEPGTTPQRRKMATPRLRAIAAAEGRATKA